MFRRSRFSVRPNVGTAGRTATTPQNAPSKNQEATETPRDTSDSKGATAVADNKPVAAPTEQTTGSGDGGDQNGDGTNASAAVQRRKRFSIKPKVTPGRPATLSRKSPVKASSETAVEVSGSVVDKPATSSHTSPTATPQGLQSPKRRRTSEDNKLSKMQPKVTPIPSNSSAASTVPASEDSPLKTNLPADSSKHSGPVKETPSRPPDRVPLIIPDREAIELSEKAKTLVSSKSELSLSPSALSLSRLLNDPSDIHRLAKAQKLRQLLREERHKEKKLKKAKTRQKEYTLDPSKMTMRDLIRYLPMSNPMTSSLENSTQENETVVPTSQEREESPERAQVPEVLPDIRSPREEENEEVEEDQEDALMVPQVKVAEDGSLIIDEESLTVEVQRAKGPNLAQERDPIFERGSTTTYSSFRTTTCPKPWSSEETDMFFLAISMVGTDFSMICQLFPHRARAEIKSKFKREERANSWRIDKAFKERRRLDIEYFSKLLEKILEFQKSRKKLKSLAEKNSSSKQRKTKAKGNRAARKLSDVEEDDEEDENEVPDLDEEEGEKENEHLCNEGGSSTSKPKRQQKRKSRQEEKNKMDEKSIEPSTEQASTPEDCDAAPEDPTNTHMSEKNENVTAAKDTAVKPAKLSRGKAPKAILPLGRKWGRKAPPPATMAKDIEDQSVGDGASKEQENKGGSPSVETSERISDDDEISSEEEEAVVQPPRPTRYGRVPKPTKLQTSSSKEDAACSESDATPASPNRNTKPNSYCKGKRGRASKPQSDQESKKPKLITLKASRSDFSDEENEEESKQDEVMEEPDPEYNSSKDGSPAAFVPATLRSPHPIISVVEETMEELDILANMPDVLSISQDALSPDASYEQAQNEMDTAEPCEHQLDLLVDVIEFLSSEHTSEDESYNEAAQTLLTISNLTPLSQTAQIQMATRHLTETISNIATSLEGEIPSNPAANSEDVAALDPGNSTVKTSDHISNEQGSGLDMNHNLQLQPSPESSKTNSSQTRRSNVSEVKPKFDLGQTSRTTQPESQPQTSTVTKFVPNEATSEIPACNPASFTRDIFCPEEGLTEEPSGSRDRSPTNIESGLMNYQNVSESDSLSDAQFVPTLKHATEKDESLSAPGHGKRISHAETTEIASTNSITAEISVTEPHVELGSNADFVLAHEDTQNSAAAELPVSKEPVTDVASACQSTKGQLQKRKPKPNLLQTSRTARLKTQITKSATEKDSSPTQVPEFHKGTTTAAVGTKQTCATPPGKPNQNTGPAPDLTPPEQTLVAQSISQAVEASSCVGSSLTPAEESSITEEQNADVGVFGQEGSDATSSQSDSKIQKFSQVQFQLSSKQTRGVTTSESVECSNIDPGSSDSAVIASEVGQGSNKDSAPVEGDGDHSAAYVPTAAGIAVSQTIEEEAPSIGGLQKVRPKPTLAETARGTLSEVQTTEDPVMQKPFNSPSRPEFSANPTAELEAQLPGSNNFAEMSSALLPPLELCTNDQEFPTSEGQNADAEVGLHSSSGSSESNLPQRRRRFPKVKPKPNLTSSIRTTRAKLQDVKPQKHQMEMPVEKSSTQTQLESTGQDSETMTATHCPLKTELLTSTRPDSSESEMSLDTMGASSDMIVATSGVADNQFMLTDSDPNKKSGKSTDDKMLSNNNVDVGLASQGDCKQDTPTRVTQLKSQPADDPSAHTSACPIPDPKESSCQSCPAERSQHLSQQSSEMSENNQTSNKKSQSANSNDDSQAESTDTSTTLKKASSTRRGRLKPRPNVGRATQPPQIQQVQSSTQAAAESSSYNVDSLDSQLASELRPEVQEPVEGAVKQPSSQDSPPEDSGSSLSCLSKMKSIQSTSTSSLKDAQNDPALTMFPGLLAQQVPSDPDEPFFILSLTEIPVCTSGEVVDRAAESLPYRPLTDASVQQQSRVPGESLAAAGGASRSEILLPSSTEEGGELSLITLTDIGPDPAAHVQDSIVKSPVDAHDGATVQSRAASDNGQSNDDIERTSAKQQLPATGRTAKFQVKSSSTRRTRHSKTLPKITTQDLHHHRPSVQPEASGTTGASGEVASEPQKGSVDQADVKEEAGTHAEESCPGTPSQSTNTRSRSRNSKDFLSFPAEKNSAAASSGPARGKTVSKSSKVKTSRAAGKQSSTTMRDAAATPSRTQTWNAAHHESPTVSPTQTEVDVGQTPTPSTSQRTAEVSDFHQIEDVESDSTGEPISISQYFLTDIFTEVEEA